MTVSMQSRNSSSPCSVPIFGFAPAPSPFVGFSASWILVAVPNRYSSSRAAPGVLIVKC